MKKTLGVAILMLIPARSNHYGGQPGDDVISRFW